MIEGGKGFVVKSTEAVAGAVSFDRILITGLLTLVGVILIFTWIIAWRYGNENKESVTFTLALYKDIAIALVSGLIGNLSAHSRETRRNTLDESDKELQKTEQNG